MPDLNDAPQQSGRDDMVFGTDRSRLALATEQVGPPEARYTFAESPATFGRYRESAGIDNPYGSGVAAYEPNTILFSDYSNAYGRVQQSKSDEQMAAAVKSAGTTTYNFGAAPGTGAPGAAAGRLPNLPDATGMLGKAIDYALDMAKRRVPYVWGGTSLNGADCSGMLYAVFKAAGIPDAKRYRAIDYGSMGVEVSAQDARPGDVIYWDNPGTDTDHVGLYVGNGKVVQAPQTGDVVRVSAVTGAAHYRRIYNDDMFAQAVTPNGGSAWIYGATARNWNTAAVTPPANTITRGTRSMLGRN